MHPSGKSGTLTGEYLQGITNYKRPTLVKIAIYSSYSSRSSARLAAQDPQRKLSDIDLADDIAPLENTAEQSQKQLDTFSRNAEKVGLEINIEKNV